MARRKPGDTKPGEPESTAIQALRADGHHDDGTARLWHGLAVVLAKRLEQRDPEWVKHFVFAEYSSLTLTLSLHSRGGGPNDFRDRLDLALQDLERRPRPKRGNERAWDLWPPLIDQYNWLLARLQDLRKETADRKDRAHALRQRLQALYDRMSYPRGPGKPPNRPLVSEALVLNAQQDAPEQLALDMLSTLHGLGRDYLHKKLLPKLRKRGAAHLAAGKASLIQLPRP